MDNQATNTQENNEVSLFFRAMDENELYMALETQMFALHPERAQVKYFGLNLNETLAFANHPINSQLVGIVEARVHADFLTKIENSIQVDTFIFKSGTVVVNAQQLASLNAHIISIRQVY